MGNPILDEIHQIEYSSKNIQGMRSAEYGIYHYEPVDEDAFSDDFVDMDVVRSLKSDSIMEYDYYFRPYGKIHGETFDLNPDVFERAFGLQYKYNFNDEYFGPYDAETIPLFVSMLAMAVDHQRLLEECGIEVSDLNQKHSQKSYEFSEREENEQYLLERLASERMNAVDVKQCIQHYCDQDNDEVITTEEGSEAQLNRYKYIIYTKYYMDDDDKYYFSVHPQSTYFKNGDISVFPMPEGQLSDQKAFPESLYREQGHPNCRMGPYQEEEIIDIYNHMQTYCAALLSGYYAQLIADEINDINFPPAKMEPEDVPLNNSTATIIPFKPKIG